MDGKRSISLIQHRTVVDREKRKSDNGIGLEVSAVKVAERKEMVSDRRPRDWL